MAGFAVTTEAERRLSRHIAGIVAGEWDYISSGGGRTAKPRLSTLDEPSQPQGRM